jgi:hypothetical protein
MLSRSTFQRSGPTASTALKTTRLGFDRIRLITPLTFSIGHLHFSLAVAMKDAIRATVNDPKQLD